MWQSITSWTVNSFICLKYEYNALVYALVQFLVGLSSIHKIILIFNAESLTFEFLVTLDPD